MDPRTFAVERLGVGDWPIVNDDGQVISLEEWLALTDADSKIDGPVAFSFDVTPDRSYAAIGVAGKRDGGMHHVEIVDHARGTGWVAAKLALYNERHSPIAVICDAAGPAASLLVELEDLGVKVKTVTANEHAQACGLFYDAVDQRTVRHLGTSELASAIRNATKRPLGDAWAWSRKTSRGDISPLVAVTLAMWAAAAAAPAREPWSSAW